MTITPKNIEDEQSRLESVRDKYQPLKVLCTQLALPGRSDQWVWYDSFDGKTNKSRKIYDATAIKGQEIWSTGIIGQYMPKEINWFAEQMSDRKLMASKVVRGWLQDTDEHLRYVLNQSNYYEQKLVAISDSGVIGDSFMFIEEDKSNNKLMMLTPHPREFWIRRDFWGRIVCIHHKFTKTILEVAEEFGGKKALSESQALSLEKNPNAPVTIIHAIYKNKDYRPLELGVKNMLWQHYYLNVEAKKIIEETGTQTLNPIPWSLNRPSHEQYGRGIVAQMLVEILTANFMGEDMLDVSQQSAKPAMIMTSAIKHKLDLGAGAVNFVGSRETQGLKMGDLVARLIDTSGYPFGQDNHSRWQSLVEDRFGVPLFLAMNYGAGNAKTAYEIRQRQAERATLMAPFLSTLGTVTDMEFDRIYSIELESGRAPEPPMEVLQSNGKIDIQYIGPLSQLLKQYYETGNLLTTISNIREVLSVAPQSNVVFDGDELMRKILQSGNTPEDIILSPEDVMQIKAIAQQQQEDNMRMELAAKTAKMVPDLNKKIEGDSVLSALKNAA